ncbi:unnamed protein product [Lupinus luteus]|uniref:Uncharacterized protein n=1 Tax=Lupinus luteus TaxID=3873 RepID=A0AAV1VSM1_LUPLU
MVSSLEKKIDETEKRYEEANRIGEERLKQALEAESKLSQLKNAMESLAPAIKKAKAWDDVNKSKSSSDSLEHISTPVAEETCVTPVKKFGTESDAIFRRSFIERQLNEDDNDLMAYWLSNTSALLFLLEQSLISDDVTPASPARRPPDPTSLFGRMTVMNLPYIRCNLISGLSLIPFFVQSYCPCVGRCAKAPRTSKGVLRSGWNFGKDSAMGH